MSLEHAQTASRQMQEGKFRSARATLAKVEVSAVNHKEQISYLAQRYNAVQEHYIQKEKELTNTNKKILQLKTKKYHTSIPTFFS